MFVSEAGSVYLKLSQTHYEIEVEFLTLLPPPLVLWVDLQEPTHSALCFEGGWDTVEIAGVR